jgi:pimeloyl-ACP methyl ester carboxylesterase
MERYVEVAPAVRIWAEDRGSPDASPPTSPALSTCPTLSTVLLIMGANASGLAWPEAILDHLAEHHHVIRYDHRDTGRSTWGFDAHPFTIGDLATDALAVLDAFGVERAHVVGLSLGGMLTQLLMLDRPERVLSATLLQTRRLPVDPDDQAAEPPGPTPAVLAMWAQFGDPRDRETELAWRVEHWRVLSGDVLPFDPAEFRALEERVIAHAGRHDIPTGLARADGSALFRGDELAKVSTRTLVLEGPEDPAIPPPNSAVLAAAIPGARLVTIPGMGHGLPAAVVDPVAEAILGHTRRAAP